MTLFSLTSKLTSNQARHGCSRRTRLALRSTSIALPDSYLVRPFKTYSSSHSFQLPFHQQHRSQKGRCIIKVNLINFTLSFLKFSVPKSSFLCISSFLRLSSFYLIAITLIVAASLTHDSDVGRELWVRFETVQHWKVISCRSRKSVAGSLYTASESKGKGPDNCLGGVRVLLGGCLPHKWRFSVARNFSSVSRQLEP